MSELHSMSDRELVAALTELEHRIAWPPSPDLASRVVGRTNDRSDSPPLPSGRLSMSSRRRTVLLLVAAFLAIAAAAVAARLVIELGAVTIEVTQGTPSRAPTDVLDPNDLGRRVSLGQAETIAGAPLALPVELGPPGRIWVEPTEIQPVSEGGGATRIVSAWRSSARLPAIPGSDVGALLMQFQGNWEAAAKQLFTETNRYGQAVVGDAPAFWTTGPHELTLISSDGSHRVLVTGNVLIWHQGRFTFRLETSVPKAEAIAIAETVKPSTDPA